MKRRWKYEQENVMRRRMKSKRRYMCLHNNRGDEIYNQRGKDIQPDLEGCACVCVPIKTGYI